MAAASPSGPGGGFGDTGRGEAPPSSQEDPNQVQILITPSPPHLSEAEKLKKERELRVEWIINKLMEESGEFIPLSPCAAANIGDTDTIKQGITRGADINEFNRGGWTPLMYAAYIGHTTVTKFLMDSGAKSELHDRYYRTPLMLAASCGNDKVVTTLLEYQANMNAQDKKGWNALFYASCLNHTNTVRVLLKRGADPNQQEKLKGLTPFHLACGNGHELMAQIFLEYGVDLTVRTKSGDTARSLAVMNHRVKIVDLIDRHRQGTTASGKKSDKNDKYSMDLPDLAAFSGVLDSERRRGSGASKAPPRPQPQLSIVEEKPTAAVAGVTMSPRINLGSNNNSDSLRSNDEARRASITDVIRMRPKTLTDLLGELQLSKYLPIFEEQAVDLPAFLQLTDRDLKDVGIKLLGPRKKMTNAIARWHSEGPVVSGSFNEVVYANYQREKADNAQVKLQEVSGELMKLQERFELQTEEYINCQKLLDNSGKALDACKDLMQANKNLVKLCLTHAQNKGISHRLRNAKASDLDKLASLVKSPGGNF